MTTHLRSCSMATALALLSWFGLTNRLDGTHTLAATAPSSTQQSCRVTGWFYINDRLAICDPNGQIFVPIGTNMMPHYAGEPMLQDAPGPVMSPPVLAKLKVWNFNTVRLNLLINAYGINPSLTKIQRYIRSLRALGLVVIVEPHDYTGRLPNQAEVKQIVEWHQRIGESFKDDPYVWFNLMNEPGKDLSDSAAQQWRNVHIQIIDALRKTNPSRLLIVDVPNFGIDDPDTPNFAKSAALKYGKAIRRHDRHLLFSLHTWWGWNYQSERKLRAYVQRMHTAGLPLIFGEFGNKVNDQVPPMNAARATVKIGREMGIGRLVWEWFGDETNYLVDAPQKRAYLLNSGTQPTNLTELGRLVWQDTHFRHKP